MIVGRISDEQLKKLLEKKTAERERAERRRKARERAERVQAHLRQASQPLTQKVEGLHEVADRLRKEREEATKQGLTRRNRGGRWISRNAQAEAIVQADNLAKRGF